MEAGETSSPTPNHFEHTYDRSEYYSEYYRRGFFLTSYYLLNILTTSGSTTVVGRVFLLEYLLTKHTYYSCGTRLREGTRVVTSAKHSVSP